MRLKIFQPSAVFLDTEITRLVGEGPGGSFGILPRHIDMATALLPGILTYETDQGGGRSLTQKDIETILTGAKTVAIIGLSQDEAKASNQVAKYLKEHGYKIVPINPTTDRILGEKAYRSLLETPAEIQESIEVIDIFRPSEEVTAIVDQAISLKKFGKLQGIWMQLGIENHEAAEKAKKAGLTVIMN